jgi:hypothetical protein
MLRPSTKSLRELLALHASGDPENELTPERVEEIHEEIRLIEYAKEMSDDRDRDDKRDGKRVDQKKAGKN